MTKSPNLVNHAHLIYEVLRSYPANFMKLSQLFMEMCSFETIHAQRWKRHDVPNDVKIIFLICGLAGCMKIMIVVSNILFYYH